VTVTGQKTVNLTSPDGSLKFTFSQSAKSIMYKIEYKGKEVIDYSTISLLFDDGLFYTNLQQGKPVYRDTTDNYELVVGKTKSVHAHYKEVIIPLEEKKTPFRKINFVVRAFNDGIAFRYEFLKQNHYSSYVLLDENTTFKLHGDPLGHALFLPNYTTSHEGNYTSLKISDMTADSLMDMPATFEFPGPIYLSITEAALVDYAGMYLSKHDNALVSKLSPLPNRNGIKVKAILPHHSPWRVLMISDRIGALIESNMLTSLNEPCKIKDVSWIKPGKTTFPWWNGNVVPDTINAPGNNFVTNKYYIDFCALNHIEYHSVVEYGLHQWYMDDGVGFQPGPHSDVTTPVPGLDMKEICDYAKTEGVDVRVWVHFYALYPRLDTAFAIFEKWGLKGMMVDFMDRDDQEMVNMQVEILQKAAAHHLHIQFHGAYKPTGLSRTWPNEFTREGTRNYEVDKWDEKGINPDHDITMPFTRGLAGSTDYHLGGFRAVPQHKFRAQYTRPLVLGTRCHMLGMYVVLENYLQMVCDYPEAYEGQPGFEFIEEIPTTWDETKVLDAKVNEYIVIARRKNNDWYLGAINNHQPRDIDLQLSFLENGKYDADLYLDANDTDTNPNHIGIQRREVGKADKLTLKLAAGGGFAIRLLKK
ncbi:MAG: glycoside hydrolase family 97 protein, partial [Bacteroidota bacterium]|nr:glycoside hydrolase family 97 protein [Bacteroidota bacterium]